MLHKQKEEIKKQYESGLSSSEVGLLHNLSKQSILNVLHQLNTVIRSHKGNQTSRKYSINDSFFEKIDTELKAYLLGFIAADATIYSDNKRNCLVLEIQKDDLHIVKTLRDSVCPLKPITEIQPRGISKKVRVRLVLSSIKLVKDLKVQGIYPRKSYVGLSFPELGNCLLDLHFIRGYLDGNGTISTSIRNNKERSYIGIECSDYRFLCSIAKKLEEHGVSLKNPYISASPGNTKHLKRNINSYCLNYSSKTDLILIYKLLYLPALIFLPRKKDKLTLIQENTERIN